MPSSANPVDPKDHSSGVVSEAQKLLESGKADLALRLLEKAIRGEPRNPAIWRLLGNACNATREHALAAIAYSNFLKLGQTSAEVHHNLGCAHYRLGDVEAALEHLQAAAAQGEDLSPWTAMATMIPAHPGISSEQILAIRRAYAKKLADHNPNLQLTSRPHPKSNRLQVGFLSAHFDLNNYMKPVWGLIDHLDRREMDIHLLSDALTEPFTGYHRHRRDRLHMIRGMDNRALAALIHNLGLDLLIDLNAYSFPERLALFAHPSELRAMAWFNMFATSGLPGFDALIGDRWVFDPQDQKHFSEAVIRLAFSYLCFQVGYRVPKIAPPPSLQNGFITFGCLAPLYKLNNAVLQAWAEILCGAPSARMVIANQAMGSVHNREHLTDRLRQTGIDPGRIDLLGPAEHFTFLRYYDQVDISLDTFPYNGGTTTMESLWQGVPVIVFPGDRWASRIGTSLVANTHLGDFSLPGLKPYIQAAIDLANDSATPSRLDHLRSSMRRRLRKAPICDTAGMSGAFRELILSTSLA